jgi:hypothetical protein
MTEIKKNAPTKAGVILGNAVYRYAQKTFDDRYLKNDGVDFYIYALVVSKKKPKLNGFTKLGRNSSIPSEIARDLSEAQQEYAKKHRSHLYFLKIEGLGWDWSKANGAKGAAKIQEALNYLKRFKSKDKVGGVEAIYIEINSKVRGKKKNAASITGTYHEAGYIRE